MSLAQRPRPRLEVWPAPAQSGCLCFLLLHCALLHRTALLNAARLRTKNQVSWRVFKSSFFLKLIFFPVFFLFYLFFCTDSCCQQSLDFQWDMSHMGGNRAAAADGCVKAIKPVLACVYSRELTKMHNCKLLEWFQFSLLPKTCHQCWRHALTTPIQFSELSASLIALLCCEISNIQLKAEVVCLFLSEADSPQLTRKGHARGDASGHQHVSHGRGRHEARHLLKTCYEAGVDINNWDRYLMSL